MRVSIFTARKLYRIVLFVNMFMLAGLCFAQKNHRTSKKHILVVHSYHEGLTWTDGQNRGITKTLDQHEKIELFIEYLDSKRFSLDEKADIFARYLIGKYNTIDFDAIIVSDDNALTFLAGCHKSLFPKTPVIFCGVNNFKFEYLKEFNGLLTGVVQMLCPSGTIMLMQKLQPDLERLVVVSCTTPTARSIRDQVKTTMEEIDTGLRVAWLDELDTETLCRRLSGLSGKDAVLLCNFNRDANGVYYSHEESARMISKVSTAPVYAMEDHYLGTGIAGGYMNSSIDQGRMAAELCLEFLRTGKVPDVHMNTPNRIMFDHAALMRFNLNDKALPPSSIFINKPRSFYQQYKNLINNVLLVFLLLVLAFVGVSYGLVKSRRSAGKLRVSEEHLRTTLDSIGDAVITTDTEGRVLRMNPIARNLTGWRIEDARGLALEDVFKIVNSHTHKPVDNPVAKVLESGEVAGLANHTELISRDGRRFQISDSAAPIKDLDGVITGVVLVFRDVTDDYEIRMALQESERKYRLFAENAGDLIWTCQGTADRFTVSYINPAVEKILGYTQEEYLALSREKRLDAESIRLIDETLQGMKPGDSRTIDIRHIHKDGHLVDCELWAKPLIDEKGRMYGFQGRTIDITERKRAGEELRRMQKLEELGTVAGGIAHDFNNLLGGIFGNLELAKLELSEDSSALSFIQTAYNTIETARGLTGQLLTFATGGAPEISIVNTAELVRESVDFNLHGSNIQVEFNLPEGLWPLEADKGQIGQVIANLVTNARQAMPDGGTLCVEACNLPSSAQNRSANSSGDMVQIKIRDEGQGIPPDIIERIFDPYFTTKDKGHGLGLAVVTSIIVQHNGTIDVRSMPGAGSTFEICLPAHSAFGGVDSEDSPVPDSVSADASALRILVMDDEPIILQLCEKMITHLGHNVDTVGDGEAAIKKYTEAMAEEQPYDIVIMDLTIRGGMGGEETVRNLLKIDPSVRAVVASGYASDPVIANYSDYGFQEKMPKPYALKDLKEVIARVSVM